MKLAHVTVLVAVLGASFFVGRQSFGSTADYEHANVLAVAESCGDGQFIGGCTQCKECTEFEYSAGGCSYFKDTFCTLCNSIRHCQQANIRCSTKDDQVCTDCDAGYWDKDCKPCTVCKEGFFEAEACTQNSDTVCQKCTACEANEYRSVACSYFADGECEACSECDMGLFQQERCENQGVTGDDDLKALYTVRSDTLCAECPDCGEDQFVTSVCTIAYGGATGCTDCSKCADGEFVKELCVPGDKLNSEGIDTMCQTCQARKDNEWEVFPCISFHTSDALYKPCTSCVDGEYLFAECTATSDTICPACPDAVDMLYEQSPGHKSGLMYCMKDEDGKYFSRCDSADESSCEDDDNNYCMEGHFGGSCCYHKYNGSCGTHTTRERSAIRTGFYDEYKEHNPENFVDFCRVLCDEFPDCMAFEVLDGGDNLDESGQNNLGGDPAISICYFKAAYTQSENLEWMGSDPAYDCYSNTCRQNKYFTTSSGAKTQIINYKVPSQE